MCGISGVHRRTPNSKADIELFVARQHHRGKDNSTTMRVADNIYFGHNRLAIIDLSENGNQPNLGPTSTTVFNGEIYNYAELGHENDSICVNTQVGYGLGGDDLIGMFAVAAYHPFLKTIELTVDRMGEKPLYWYKDEDTFCFASTIEAITTVKDSWELNTEGLNSFWALGATMGDKTLFNGIKRLSGGYRLVYDIVSGDVKISRWYTPQPRNPEKIEDKIIEAIEYTKVSDVPVFTFLSGGIDSTLVASRVKGGAIHLDGPEYPYAKQVADKYGIELHVVKPKTDYINDLRDYSAKTGEPAMAALIPYITSKETARYCKVAITANGADELFCGYDRHKWSDDKWVRHIFRPNYEPFLEEIEAMYPIPSGLDRRRWIELMTYVQYDLNRTLDSGSMCHTLEVRSPFLNHELVETALSIPTEGHFGKYGAKNILKTMLEREGFGRAFLTRPKLGFSLHVADMVLEHHKDEAYRWCKENGFLPNLGSMTGRDLSYTRSAALSFKCFMDVHGKLFGL